MEKLKKTGFDVNGFRPMTNHIALILTDEDLEILGSPHAKKEKKSKIETGQSLYKGDAVEKEEKEKEKENRTYTVAGLAMNLVDNEDGLELGDEVSLFGQTVMTEIVVEGKVYVIVPYFKICSIHKEKVA